MAAPAAPVIVSQDAQDVTVHVHKHVAIIAVLIVKVHAQ